VDSPCVIGLQKGELQHPAVSVELVRAAGAHVKSSWGGLSREHALRPGSMSDLRDTVRACAT